MATPATTDALVTLVRKSGLVNPACLDEFLTQPEIVALPADNPRKLARRLVKAALLTDFHARQLLVGKYRGFVLGPYLLLEDLPTESATAAYLAEHRANQERLTVRMLPEMGEEKSQALLLFYREAQAAGVDHPHLVTKYGVERDGKQYFLSAPYVDGACLGRIVRKRGPLDLNRAAHYIRQAAQGLQHLHERGLAHLDLSPQQLLLDRQGVVRVLLFGLACFLEGLPVTEYLAPEQATSAASIDIRTDIYSLGATFHFLLTGKPPSSKESLGQLRPETPAGLTLVIDKMLAREPAQRYQTPAEVVEALAPWTATPIAPPTAEEIPELSPAAQAAGFTWKLVMADVAIPSTTDRRSGSNHSLAPKGVGESLPPAPDEPDEIILSHQPGTTSASIPTLTGLDTDPDLAPPGAPTPDSKPELELDSTPAPASRQPVEEPRRDPEPPPSPRPGPRPPVPAPPPRRSGVVKLSKSGSIAKPSAAKKPAASGARTRLGREFWLVLLFLLLWIPLGYGLSSLFRSDDPEAAQQAPLPPPAEKAVPPDGGAGMP